MIKGLLVTFSALLLLIPSCKQRESSLNALAEDYVRIGLFIGQYDTDFVDAYYGPDSLKPLHKPAAFPKDSVLNVIRDLAQQIGQATGSEIQRGEALRAQLEAFERRVKIFSGETGTFDGESADLFGVQAPAYPESHYRQIVDSLASILPGSGNVGDRFQALADRFVIPKDKLDTVFKAAIAESRKRTLENLNLPEGESFNLEYVSNKPWNGYNWYKGNFESLIQINTDIRIFIERAIDIGSHESYPGHHVYNMLLESNLYRKKGWVETSLYPLFSPQSLIAEGSANYGVDLIFPGNEKLRFATEVLLPLAGLDTTYAELYFRALALKAKLNYARNEAARGLIDGKMTEAEALRWLQSYCLFNEETARKSIDFIKKYRSYVINYNYGQDLVRNFVERGSGDRWSNFERLLSEPMLPSYLK